MDGNLNEEIKAYIDANWDEILADIESLVCIESVEDMESASPGAPFGPGPRAALTRVLSIAERMGFSVCDCEGFVGYAELAGESDDYLGIIGHVDVVPAGPGWTVEPFALTRHDGYVLGRGVADDKGPLVIALHAVKFWADKLASRAGNESEPARFPYSLRVLFGVNEETNMADVAYYRNHFADPVFLFTPDAEFPVCHGESGICHGVLRSAPVEGGVIAAFEAGVAPNAVPGEARAVVNVPADALPAADQIDIEPIDDGRALVFAHGASAHASTPERGQNALSLLVDYLLVNDVCTYEEKKFLLLQRALLRVTDGSGLGIEACDEHFGALTAVGSMVRFAEGVIEQTIDFRYPTTTSAEEISLKVNALASLIDATFEITHDAEPFLMSADAPAVQALLSAYNEVMHEDARPFTMKGGTYARMFPRAASFGPDKPDLPKPDWAGSMHGPDEAIGEELLEQAFSIYVHTIPRLMEIDWTLGD